MLCLRLDAKQFRPDLVDYVCGVLSIREVITRWCEYWVHAEPK